MTQAILINPDRLVRPVSGDENHIVVLGAIGRSIRRALDVVAREAALHVLGDPSSNGQQAGSAGVVPRAVVIDLDAGGARELCSFVRSNPLLSHAPLLGLSRSASDLTFDEAFCWGVDDVIETDDILSLTPRLRGLRALASPIAQPGKGRALVVDADRDRRALAARALHKAGFEIQFAADLDEADSRAASMVVAVLHASPGGAVKGLRRARENGSTCPWVISVPPALLRETRAAVVDIPRVALHDAYSPPDNILFSANEMASARLLEQRSAPRLLCGTRVWMRPAGGERDILGYTYNMSEGGLFVRTLAPIDPAHELWLELCAPRTGRRVRLTAVARWQRPFGPIGAALSPAGVGFSLIGGLAGDLELFRRGCRQLTSEMS